jgi:hypothetical protein
MMAPLFSRAAVDFYQALFYWQVQQFNRNSRALSIQFNIAVYHVFVIY